MSFAAVAAMIAAFEKRAGATDSWGRPIDPKEPAADRRATWLGRTRLVLGSMIVTTLVASFATDPYASYHFHRITPFGLIGNMLVLPLVEFIVMPAAVLGVLANPFGLDGPVWWLMGQGTAFMLEVRDGSRALMARTLHLPAFGPAALLAMTVGLLWIVLWQKPLRWLGMPVLGGGIVLAARPPSNRTLSSTVRAAVSPIAWRMAVSRCSTPGPIPSASPSGFPADADARKPTDPSLPVTGCVMRGDVQGCARRSGIGAHTRTRDPRHDCARADVVVTPIFAEGLCKGPERLIDGAHLAAHGATACGSMATAASATICAAGDIRQAVVASATTQPAIFCRTGWTPAIDPNSAGRE